MSQSLPPPIPQLLPDSAPFTAEQRAWLNGFFAGYLGLGDGVTALSPEEGAALMAGVPALARGPLDDGDDGEAPWHDQTIALPDRMTLAQGRPLRRRMMAAMAQQDCGQCGYNCEDYANLIVTKKEERLNLCVPGGKDTARMLKSLYEELGKAAPAAEPAVVTAPGVAVPSALPSRSNPATATFLKRTRLNKAGSQKETWHVEIALAGTDRKSTRLNSSHVS